MNSRVYIWYSFFFFLLCLPKEIEKLRLELSESKQHVEQEQQKAAQARQECLQVTELLGESERQLHLTRYALIPPCTQHPVRLSHWLLPQAAKQLLVLVIQFAHSFQAYYRKWICGKQNTQTREWWVWQGITDILQNRLSTVLKYLSDALSV